MLNNRSRVKPCHNINIIEHKSKFWCIIFVEILIGKKNLYDTVITMNCYRASLIAKKKSKKTRNKLRAYASNKNNIVLIFFTQRTEEEINA